MEMKPDDAHKLREDALQPQVKTTHDNLYSVKGMT